MPDTAVIFCDGSSLGNPGPGGWGAIVSLNGKIFELGGSENPSTNNRVELLAAINGVEKTNSHKEVEVYTDSSYVVNGMTKWIFGWQKNNWITTQKGPVSNQDLWKKLIEVCDDKKIKWNYVPGHAGVPGNERCDAIAVAFAWQKNPELFRGKVADYAIDLSVKTATTEALSKKSAKDAPAYSYVALIDGQIEIFKTWKECEAAVRGVSGAKFKKTRSKEEEATIIAEWKK